MFKNNLMNSLINLHFSQIDLFVNSLSQQLKTLNYLSLMKARNIELLNEDQRAFKIILEDQLNLLLNEKKLIQNMSLSSDWECL